MLKSGPVWMPKGIAALMGSALLGFAITASALPVSEYSLILLGDLDARNTQIHARSLISGNVTGQNTSFGTRLDKSTGNAVAQIGGNLIEGATVEAGYIEIGGRHGAINCNGNGLTQNRCVRAGTPSQNQLVDLERQLHDDTLNISRLQSNGEVVVDGNQKALRYSGSESVAVFGVDGALLFSQNSNWSLDRGAAETVIINVSGDILPRPQGVNFNGFPEGKVLWNFTDARRLDFGDIRFEGFVLAAFADIEVSNAYLGGLAARSYDGGGHIGTHRYPHLDLPGAAIERPSVAVSEPSMLAMLAGGLGMLGLAFRRRRSGL